MDFVTAEEKFQELNARIRRGEPLSEDQYQEELAQLMVQDEAGVFWSLEPGTGRWLFFNGTEWVAGTPPKQPAAPPPAPLPPAPIIETPPVTAPQGYEPPPYQGLTQPPAEPVGMAPAAQMPQEPNRPTEYPGAYPTGTTYPTDPNAVYPGTPATGGTIPVSEPEGIPQYVRMPEPEPASTMGGIPPRPVRDASPLAVPGGERAWLPIAFGALVLLLCAVVLLFGIRGLPPFSGGTANTQPTEVPTESVTEVLPTETVQLAATEAPQPTAAPTEAPQPTAAPQPIMAVASDVLNIRQGPARTTASLGKLQKGQQVTVVARNADASWLQIQIPDKTDLGWVSADFVTVTGDVNSLPVAGTSGSAKPKATETPTG